MIVLDTSVLSLAFRRLPSGPAHPAVVLLRRMIETETPLAVPGIVLQELLSGVRDDLQFARLEGLLEGFPILLADRSDHATAAKFYNQCRRHGVTPTSADCLIAALTVARDATLLTLDVDFQPIERYCRLRLVKT